LAGFPEDLAEDAEGEFGISGRQVEAADEAAYFFFSGCGGAPFLRTAGTGFQIAAGAEGVEQERGEALEIGGGGGDMFLRPRNGLGIAREFVEADGDGLTEVHGAMLFAGGDAQEPVAVAEVFIRKTALLRTEKKGDAAAGGMFVKEQGGLIKAVDGVLHLTLADGGGSDDECAILDGFGEGLELFGAGEQRRGANRGARLAKSQLVGVYYAKMEETEVAHGAGGGTDIERITRADEDDAQAIGFGAGRQGTRVYSTSEVTK